jgi:putative copper resistance protein D
VDVLNLGSWLAKVLLYLATAGVIGGYYITLLSKQDKAVIAWLRYYSLSAALLGLCSVILAFMLQLLQFSGQGWASFTDWELYGILLAGNMSLSWGLAFGGFALFAISRVVIWRQTLLRSVAPIACLCIVLAYTFSGHLVHSPWYGQLTLLLHLIAVSIWIGSLLPLWQISRITTPALTARLMQQFGVLALFFVGLLLLAGGLMLLLLLEDLRQLWQTAYGQTLLVKFSLVLLLLGLGAINKLVLVPQLPKPRALQQLRAVIRIELIAGVLVLGVTAWATVVIGLDMSSL